MKSIITLLAAVTISFLGSATDADARNRKKNVYIDSYQSCGVPTYTQRYVAGYDECGHPVFRYRTVRSHYQPVIRQQYYAPRPQPRYQRNYHHDRHYSNSRIVIQGSFCR